MPAISAFDVISPAIQRTRNFLFRPFRWSTFLKLCLVALLTEGFGSNFNFSQRGVHPSGHGYIVHPPFIFTPGRIAAIGVGSLALILLCFIIFYLITRLRFAYFHCLIHNTREIRPGWRLYRAQAGRFFWLNAVVALCFLLLVAIVALPFVAGFWRLAHRTPPGGHPDFVLLLSLLLPLIPIIFLLIFAGIAADLILRDLMLPHFALDNATAAQAWAAARTRISAEKGPFVVYALLRVILPLVAIMALILAMIIPTLVFVGAFAIFGVLIHSALAGTGLAAIARIFLEVLAGLVAFGFLLFAGLCLGGPLGTAIREYALLFYGGRYQRLGEILLSAP